MTSRRMFLRGATGALLGIPFLSSLLPRGARGQMATPPVRYVQWVTNHGQYPENFFPDGATPMSMPEVAPRVRAQSLSAFAGRLSPVLGSAFDGIRDHFNVLRGLDVIHRRNLHNASAPTCGSANWGDDGGGPCDSHLCIPFAHSVDAVLEDYPGLYPSPVRTPVLRLTPGLSSRTKWGSFCWRDGERLFAHDTTSGAVDAVFGSGEDVPEESSESRRAALLDDVLDDYRRVRDGGRISRTDQARLDDYMDLVSGVRARLEIDAPRCVAPELAEEVDFDAMQKNATDLATAALACGATRVVAYHCFHCTPTEQMSRKHHDWAHNRGFMAEHGDMQAFRYQYLARLISNLQALRDPDGSTVLDNSIVYAANELSAPDHGSGHLESLPILTAGRAGGRFTTGRYIDFGGRPMNNLLVSIFDAMGLSPEDYEREGRTGFGDYDGENLDRYAPHLGDAARRASLEVLTAA